MRDKIVKALREVTGGKEAHLETPESEEHGDYSTNIAMQLFVKHKTTAKRRSPFGWQNSKLKANSKLKFPNVKSPRELAQKVVDQLSQVTTLMQFVSKIEAAGPGFINFWLKEKYLADNLGEIESKAGRYGSSELGKGKTMVIDYSAPNIAKSFGIGHLRSTIIGQALYNLYKFIGYKAVGDNHLGDWGTQFGKLLYMIDKAGKDANLTIDWLEDKYIEFHKLAEHDESLNNEARKWFKRLEDNDPVARELWQKCVSVSLAEFDRIYKLLGVAIDFAYGESFYENSMPEVIREAKEIGIARQSQGARIIEIPGIKAPLMLVKSDGATTYATRDLATLKFRGKKWDPDLVIYEVGVEQALHFQQVFEVARMLGYVKRNAVLVHTKHGLYTGKDGKKLSTRQGKSSKLEDVLLESVDRARKLGCEDEETARAVGIGAVKYFDLKHSPQSNIIFDWDKMFELEGNSGPYIQYTVARTKSVLRMAKIQNPKSKIRNKLKTQNPKFEFNKEELSVLRHLIHFPEIVISAAQSYSPNILCEYLYQLASKYNAFYNKHRILGSAGHSLELRLKLTSATGQVLANGLKLLGIDAPERM